ncbi:hypothetical protein V8F20_002871 [Naviculisporaceae sp. PSN 640]
MGRQEAIARSITQALTSTNGNGHGERSSSRSALGWILAFFSALFSLYELTLRKIRPAEFTKLRSEHWEVTNEAYVESFLPQTDGESKEEALTAIGDMGFSGSTFYSTTDQKYLVKSVPRYSEYSFFRDDLLTPYTEYMASHPYSLLVRICDFLCLSGPSIGRLFRLAPSHHIVMDNIMYGREQAKKRGEPDWENWDLKPTSYFYPERDIADGALTSEATKDQLADEFPDKIILTQEQADELFATLEADTKLLADYNAVDYSLFLVRLQAPKGSAVNTSSDPTSSTEAAQSAELVPDDHPPTVPPSPPSWRVGIPSADGKYIYRAAILDFFWAKHKIQPIFMTILITAWNFVFHHGHMSITTTPDEYRERFLKMCRSYVEVRGE